MIKAAVFKVEGMGVFLVKLWMSSSVMISAVLFKLSCKSWLNVELLFLSDFCVCVC